jgi:hypothetical protein
MENLEKRMYVLVNRSLSSMQKGIQASHAMIEYALKYFNDQEYFDWAKIWKTVIVLDGGTSNSELLAESLKKEAEDLIYVGQMENHQYLLEKNGIKFASFIEPDVNNLLSAICFIVDEKVFNKEKYPDFVITDWAEINLPGLKEQWMENIGEQNVFLREFLTQFRLAM